jgi:hypothetical protein
MAITDFWGNPLDNTAATAFGFRGTFDEFPHDLYSFLISTIRDLDQDDIALLYRWMIPMQQHWESQYASILAIPNLYSPENCPASLLDFLRKNIGIMDDISYLWGVLNENEKRRLIKFFVRFIQLRATGFGILEMIETMAGLPADILGYFYFRFLTSGDSDVDIEGALGMEDGDSDWWLVSEDTMPVGIIPSSLYLFPSSTLGVRYYRIGIDDLRDAVVDLPIPNRVLVRCLLTNVSTFATAYESGGKWFIRLPDGFYFDQVDGDQSVSKFDFRIAFEPDQYVYDILVVDNGELNHDMIIALARFSRPMSERIYIRYYKAIDKFESLDRWTERGTGTVTLDSDAGTVTLADGSNDSIIELTEPSDVLTWQDYYLIVKALATTVDKYFEIRFMYQDANNYLYYRVTPADPPTWPPGEWELGQVVAGTPTVLDSGDLDQFDIDVNYVWRLDCFTSERPGGDVQVVRLYQDENILVEHVIDPLPWSSVFGTIQLVSEGGGGAVVTTFRVRDIPGESDYVGV